MIECVIFDCDGTLVDSEPLANLGLEIMLRDYGVQRTAASLEREYKGWKLANVCASLEAHHTIALRETFVPEYRALLAKLFDERLEAIPGVEQALASIALPKCVASSGPPEKIRQTLRLTGLDRFFGKNIFSSYVIGSWKPDPELFLHAAKAMGFAPESCAVVEDSELGIQAARNAGMQAYWYTSEPIKSDMEGVVSFNSMSQLGGLLTQKKR